MNKMYGASSTGSEIGKQLGNLKRLGDSKSAVEVKGINDK